jgi:hypothetical protein
MMMMIIMKWNNKGSGSEESDDALAVI